MTHVIEDLVQQWERGDGGTGPYVYGPTVENRRSFGSVMQNGDTTEYKVEGKDSGGNPAWEIGIGTHDAAAGALVRSTVLRSSTGGPIDWAPAAKVLSLVTTSRQFVRPGQTARWMGGTVPAGWLVCDGSAVDRGVYAALFAAIGVIHGAGDGSTTFNLPSFPVHRVPAPGGTPTTVQMPVDDGNGGTVDQDVVINLASIVTIIKT